MLRARFLNDPVIGVYIDYPCFMAMRIATAEWADPAEVEHRYLYRAGTIWLGRSASEHQVPLGYQDDRHVCLVGGTRAGKGTTGIVPTLITVAGLNLRPGP